MKKESVTYVTTSGEETITLGRKLGAFLSEGDLISLAGELGSGKTWFTKGLALGLGVSPKTVITSPSFALMNEYEGRCPLLHMDIYRLESTSEFLDAGLDEFFYEKGVVVLEWGDRWPELLPEWSLLVDLVILDESSRQITVSGHHPRALSVIRQLKEQLNY